MARKICGFFSTILMIALLALGCVIVVPMLMGYKEMAVLSGSMEPNMKVGSLVYVKPGVNPAELKEGDVVTYYMDAETFVTHRVISIDTDAHTLVTKGDNNNVDDGDISFDRIYGMAAFWIPYLGYITIYARTRVGIMAIIAIIAVIVLLNFLPVLFEPDQKPDSKREIEQKG